MPNKVVLRPLAANDLLDIYDFIDKDSPNAALAFLESLEKRIRTLADFPERGAPRDDVRAGIRILAYKRRVVIAYQILADRVEVVRIFYAGRDYQALLGEDGGL